MSEREIEAAFLIIKSSMINSKEPDEETISQIINVICQVCIDIHRLAEAAELTFKINQGVK